VHEKSVATFYMDVKGVLADVDRAVQQFGEPQAKEMWPKVRDALGLSGVRRAIWTEAFEGKEWGSRAFLDAPGPRKGLVSLLDAEPVTDDMLKAIPQTATIAGAGRFDLHKLLTVARTAVKEVDAHAADQMDQALAEVTKQVGIDIEKDLLAPLGDEWAYYSDPMTGGKGLLGAVVINRPRDAGKTDQTLAKAADLVDQFAAREMRNEEVQIHFTEAKIGDLNVHYLAIPIVSPGWAVDGGNLYIGLFPQIVAAAAEQVSAGGKSILDNPDFVARRKQLGGERATGIQFVDLPKTAPDSYAGWMMVSRLVRVADLFGVKSPPVVLPPVRTLLAHLTPAASVSWTDDAGLHFRGVTPFPGSTIFASDPMSNMMSMQPAMMSILLPSLSRARGQADRIKSASNLRQIGLGILMYANEHKGMYPPDLDAVRKAEDLAPNVFDSPLGDVPGGDYVYLHYEGMNYKASSEVMVAYDAAARATGEGTNVLFADGHTEWLNPAQFEAAVERSRKEEPKSAPMKED
jgi:prepilin-type processing-associated H-X9-DG protein